MIRVYLSSSTNSTMFTRCCDVAICDHQANCPACKKEVYPGADGTDHQRNIARWNMASAPMRRSP